MAQQSFADAKSAVLALHAAAEARDRRVFEALLGKEGAAVLDSGDTVADARALEGFAKRMASGTRLFWESEKRAIVRIGDADWPLPFPLVKQGTRWRFDSRAGAEEILHRRIGKNELDAIRVCRALVEAQFQYRRRDWDGDGVLEYAEVLVSPPGKRNGLVWVENDGKPQGPFAALWTEARDEGYEKAAKAIRETGDLRPIPFRGYRFKVLESQGPAAPAGKYGYRINGHLLGGFAAIAYPAKWGSSGIMSFLVSHQGQLYERNLGKDTEAVAEALSAFDPEAGWKPVAD